MIQFVFMFTIAKLTENYLAAANFNTDLSDICRNDKDCTFQVNATSYQCNIGRKAECDTYQWKMVDVAAISGDEKFFYPYLSTINIEDKMRGERIIKALNFSFHLPHLSFGQGGEGQAVMAVLQYQGTKSDSYYEEPVCRIFDFQNSQLIPSDIIRQQNVTVPSDCLGLTFTPGNYSLRLTTVPTNHSLQYNITWVEYEEDAEYFDAWVQKLMAVATVSTERSVHVVFQPLEDEISVVRVELVSQLGVVKEIKVLNGQSSALFTDVDSGDYWVNLFPESDGCDNFFKCEKISSGRFRIDHSIQPKFDDYLLFIILLVILTPIFLTPLLVIIRSQCSKGDFDIFVNCLVSRELEEKISEQFRNFLSESLQANVQMTYSYSHSRSHQSLVDPKTSLIDSEADRGVHISDRLLKCHHIINVFYQSTLQCLQEASGQVTARKDCSAIRRCCRAWTCGKSRGRVLTAVFAAPPRGSVTVCDDLSSTGHITVYNFCDKKSTPSSQKYTSSMCNAPDLASPRLPSGNDVFYLPEDISKLMGSLSRGSSFSGSHYDKSEHWSSVLSMLAKLDENRPCLDFLTQSPNRSQSMITVTIDDDQSTTAGHNDRTGLPSGQRRQQDRLSEVSFSDSYSNVSEAARDMQNYLSIIVPHQYRPGVTVLTGRRSGTSSLEASYDHASSSLLGHHERTFYPPVNDDNNIPSGFQIDSGRGDSVGFFQSGTDESLQETELPFQYPETFVKSIIPPNFL